MKVPWLRVMLITLWVGCATLTFVVAGLVLGHVSAATFFWSAALGVVVGVPAALLNWAWLRPNRARQAGLNLR